MFTINHTEKADIILLAGQSNAEGWGVGHVEKPYIPNERIFMLKPTYNESFIKQEDGTEIFPIKPPFTYTLEIAKERITENGTCGCLALSFAREYMENNLDEDRKVMIVQTAVGSSGFFKVYGEWVRFCVIACWK